MACAGWALDEFAGNGCMAWITGLRPAYYERHGSGPAILFVHGSGGHHAAWWQQVAVLRSRFTVLTVDLRGFGKSDSSMPEFDGQDFPGDILAVLDREDLADVVLVGQSIGAVAALRAGLARPGRVSGVVLAHSLGGIADPELSDLVAADRSEAVKLPVLDRLLSKSFQENEPALTFLFQQMGTFNVAKMADLRNLSTGGPTVEVAWGAVDATTGAFSFSLPIEAPVKTAYVANPTTLTFTPDTTAAGKNTLEAASAGVVKTTPINASAVVPPVNFTFP